MAKKIKEFCISCNQNVKIDNKFVKTTCPNCGADILPCNICTMEKSNHNCGFNCPIY